MGHSWHRPPSWQAWGVRIAVLGPLEVWDDDGRPVEVGGTRLRALLVRLALDAGSVVTVDALVDGLWDSPPAGVANALQSLVSRLRRSLGNVIEGVPSGYRLAAVRVDAAEFERLAAEGRRAVAGGRFRDAAELLRRAEGQWRGAALADVSEAPFAAGSIARLASLRLSATEDRIEADLAIGRHGEVVADLERLAAAHPLRERVHGQLIRALYGIGRQAEALAGYERIRAALADELGVGPSGELAAVHLAVLRQDPGLLPAAPAVRAQLTSFVGRADELAGIDKLLGEARLVTIVGAGGAGKTRLAAELTGRLDKGAPDGVWFVELAPVTDPLAVAHAVLATVGIRETGMLDTESPRDAVTRLVDVFRHKRSLLVLDNCEHVVAGAAELAERLLHACPGLRILGTSREPLGVRGEMLYPIPPLRWPDDGAPGAAEALAYPAVRLFADRAVAVRPGFAVTDDTVAAVVEVCRRLDGMPLAIELAAAKLRSLPLAQIAARLDDRFRLLTGGSRTALPRHQTLQAVVEWSWDQLTEPERTVARRFSVFVGGATIEAAEHVCATGEVDVVDVLGALVDKSLLDAVHDDRHEFRYRMLETIRAYGAERLAEAGEADPVHDAHARYFAELAETAEPLLRTPKQVQWIARLQVEHGNLMAALRWTITVGDVHLADRLCAALMWYWFMQGDRAESATLVREVLALPVEVLSTPRAIVTAFGAMTAVSHGDADAEQRIADALACFERIDMTQHPLLLLLRPTLAIFANVGRRAVLHELDQALSRLDPWGKALGLMFRGFIEENEGRPEQSRRDLVAAKNAFLSTGDRWGLAMTTRALAGAYSFDGDHAAAITAYREALTYLEELGAVDDVPETTAQIGLELLRSGDLAAGHAEIITALRLARQYGQPEATIWTLCGLGEHALRSGDTAQARQYLTDALADAQAGRFPPQVAAVVLTELAGVDVAEGNTEAARDGLNEAINRAIIPADMPILAKAVQVMAGVALLSNDPEQAAVLLGSAESLRGARDRSGGDLLHTEQRTRALLGDTAFETAYARGTAMSRNEITAMLGHPTPSYPSAVSTQS